MSENELQARIPSPSVLLSASNLHAALLLWIKSMSANLLTKFTEYKLLTLNPQSTYVTKLVKDPWLSYLRKKSRNLSFFVTFKKMTLTGLRGYTLMYLGQLIVDVLWLVGSEVRTGAAKHTPPGKVALRIAYKATSKALVKTVQLCASAAVGAVVVCVTGNKVGGNLGYTLGDLAGSAILGGVI